VSTPVTSLAQALAARIVLAACIALSGCAYHVRIESTPAAATVALPNGDRVVTPETVPFRWYPFAHQRVVVSAPGYRTVEMDLGRRGGEVTFWHVIRARMRVFRNLGERTAQRVEVVLVPEHGPSGTWTPESQGLE
jgi:zona occludens toxin (predicted ATPase)